MEPEIIVWGGTWRFLAPLWRDALSDPRLALRVFQAHLDDESAAAFTASAGRFHGLLVQATPALFFVVLALFVERVAVEGFVRFHQDASGG